MPDDWSERIALRYVNAYLVYGARLRLLFEDFDKGKAYCREKVTAYHILRELEVSMPRKGKQNGTASGYGGNSSGSAGSGAKWEWANVKLTDDDIAVLERSDATLEYVVTYLASLGDYGIGITIKPVDEGKSRCVTVYRPDFPRTGVTVGVSSFASNVRDAGLACIYKLDNYLGGDFSAYSSQDDPASVRPRFR